MGLSRPFGHIAPYNKVQTTSNHQYSTPFHTGTSSDSHTTMTSLQKIQTQTILSDNNILMDTFGNTSCYQLYPSDRKTQLDINTHIIHLRSSFLGSKIRRGTHPGWCCWTWFGKWLIRGIRQIIFRNCIGLQKRTFFLRGRVGIGPHRGGHNLRTRGLGHIFCRRRGRMNGKFRLCKFLDFSFYLLDMKVWELFSRL